MRFDFQLRLFIQLFFFFAHSLDSLSASMRQDNPPLRPLASPQLLRIWQNKWKWRWSKYEYDNGSNVTWRRTRNSSNQHELTKSTMFCRLKNGRRSAVFLSCFFRLVRWFFSPCDSSGIGIHSSDFSWLDKQIFVDVQCRMFHTTASRCPSSRFE